MITGNSTGVQSACGVYTLGREVHLADAYFLGEVLKMRMGFWQGLTGNEPDLV